MDENELRAALRTTMTDTAPPPPMDSAVATTEGRRTVRRRAALTASGASAAVVLAATLGISAALRPQPGGTDAAAPAPAPSTTSAPGLERFNPSATPLPSGVTTRGAPDKPTWPLDGDGEPQDDATARSGLRYEQGRKLLDELLAVIPAGWTVPQFTSPEGIPSRSHQAQVEGDDSGDTWSYLADAAISKDDRTGQLLAEVHTTGNDLPKDLCELHFWGREGACAVIKAGAARVAVTTLSETESISQYAAYRHSDGTVVYIAQNRRASQAATNPQPLAQLPFTGAELAELAVRPEFHLS